MQSGPAPAAQSVSQSAPPVKEPSGPLRAAPRRLSLKGRDLAGRLRAALDRKMSAFEARAGGEDSAADGERDARTLTALVRLYEKLEALRAKAGPTKTKGASATALSAEAGEPLDAEKMRQSLTQKLEALRATMAAAENGSATVSGCDR